MHPINFPTAVAETGHSMFMMAGTVFWGLYLASGVNHLVEVNPFCDGGD